MENTNRNNPEVKISSVSPLSVKDYQKLIVNELSNVFSNVPIEPEWSAMTDSRDLYCPRLDVVVGPFAMGNNQFEHTYDDMMNNSHSLIDRMLAFHHENIEKLSFEVAQTSWDDLFYTNQNARCFLAIEIENEVSRKHLIGGAVNASALGRIGIVVAWNEEKLKAMVKLRRYLNFLTRVKKNSFNTENLIILDPPQLIDCIIRSPLKDKPIERF